MTGYTYELVNKNMDFKQFAMLCARAFGACISMRDDDLNKEVPEKFETDSYHKDRIKEEEENLKEFLKMSKKEQKKLLQKDINDSIEVDEKALEEKREDNKKISKVLEVAKKWKPPTSEHVRFKEFIIEQLETSLSDEDFYVNEIKRLQSKVVDEDYIKQHIEGLKENIEYHKDHYEKDKKNTEASNKWVNDLREGLKNV